MNTALTIAGSDCSGGAGIQADIKTMTANKVYGMSVITSVTVQNTLGVSGVYDMSPNCVCEQLDAVFTDIFPDSVKIGMVSNIELIRVISERLQYYKAKNIVLDPVMVSTSGHKLLEDDAVEVLTSKMFPLADIITPNIPEAQALTGLRINNTHDMLIAAETLSAKFNTRVLLKGGHLSQNGSDLLYENNSAIWFNSKHIDNPNTHGTGCTLSSAIASGLAKGMDMYNAVKYAKNYISGALEAMMNIGHGNGPVDHMWNL